MRRAAWILVLIVVSGCTPAPKPLSPEATVAFHATRVVNVLDVVRDAAIAANEVTPPLISTSETRQVVLWHKTAVQTIRVSPSGWRPVVLMSTWLLTCHPLAAPTPPSPCTPQLAPDTVQRLYPYVGLALVVVNEVL